MPSFPPLAALLQLELDGYDILGPHQHTNAEAQRDHRMCNDHTQHPEFQLHVSLMAIFAFR
jgi:hypothetical protein